MFVYVDGCGARGGAGGGCIGLCPEDVVGGGGHVSKDCSDFSGVK